MITLKEIAKLLTTSSENAYKYFVKKHGLKPVATMPDRWDEAEVMALIEGRDEDHKANLARDGNVTAEGQAYCTRPNPSDYREIVRKAFKQQPNQARYQVTISAPVHLINAPHEKIIKFNEEFDSRVHQIAATTSRRFWKTFVNELQLENYNARIVPADNFSHIVIPEYLSSDGKVVPWHYHIVFFLDDDEVAFFQSHQLIIKKCFLGAINHAINTKYNKKFKFDVAMSAVNSDFLSYVEKGISADFWDIHVSSQN